MHKIKIIIGNTTIRLNTILSISNLELPRYKRKEVLIGGADDYRYTNEDAYAATKREITFLERSLDFLNVLNSGKEVKLYFNNADRFYRGIVEDISIRQLPSGYNIITTKFILKPYIFDEVKTFTTNSINNPRAIAALPTINIIPNNNIVRFAINESYMQFNLIEIEPFIIDCENIEIYDNNGNFKNSIFTKGEFLSLKSGVNGITTAGVASFSIDVNWREFI